MNRLKTLAATLCLAASTIALAGAAHADTKRINALVMLQDAEPETMSHEVPIFRRVLPELQEVLNASGIQVYDENIDKMAFERPDNRRRNDVQLVTVARAISEHQPLDVVVVFEIVASAQKDVIEPSIVHPKVRMPARVLDVRSGQLIAAFEVDGKRLPVLPNPCDEVCLMDQVGDDAKELGGDLGAALVTKLAGFNSGGLRSDGASEKAPVISGATMEKPRLNGPSGARCEGLSSEYTITFDDFSQDEMLEIERNLRQFGCFEEMRPVRAGSTFGTYAYRTSAGTGRLDRNLRVMLDFLELKGQVNYDGTEFKIAKIATRQ